ncbi:MAG TPA: EVE domain-containing protein [Aliidongia sp.]|uniref:EVE domain-containing protein n=1 Tax=Aliidongia sp. TaxID=1914230 RepID=UPI002DDCF5CA|nr:EVE domain-containing protein [Aliidongia sp.]HEV2674881.1 EVE domain-containing protein [Aliidongia sp.]
MAYWLMKSEPYEYSWSQLVADGRNVWTGVRNYQAANNLRAMQVGDRAFFYHSNEGREIVGVMEIAKTAYPDPTDETARFVAVEVTPLMAAVTPVTLAAVKADPRLVDFSLVRQSRLSVAPVRDGEWAMLCEMAGISA